VNSSKSRKLSEIPLALGKNIGTVDASTLKKRAEAEGISPDFIDT